ncbi:MAG: DUF2726 domain-containing protein [Chloroflexi bacterium]|nr:DUF2726 domain-containing protein [Chloroflexota bacterium]
MADNKAEAQRLPYRLREPFLTTTELALFRVLNQMVGGRYLICPKVSLNDVFYIVRPNENVHFFNKFFRKHVDFLLCDPQTLAPAFGIEIVRPISKNETRESDRFVEEIFTGAGLPLVHIPSSESYDASEIIPLFQLAVAKIGGTVSLRVDRASDSVPHCPVCGKMMVLRIHRTGKNSGKQYYGCMDSPRCTGVVPIN